MAAPDGAAFFDVKGGSRFNREGDSFVANINVGEA